MCALYTSSDQRSLPPVRIGLSQRTIEEHLQRWFPEFTCNKMALKTMILSVSRSWKYAEGQTNTERLTLLLEEGIEEQNQQRISKSTGK